MTLGVGFLPVCECKRREHVDSKCGGVVDVIGLVKNLAAPRCTYCYEFCIPKENEE